MKEKNKSFKRLVIFAVAAVMCLSTLAILPMSIADADENEFDFVPTMKETIPDYSMFKGSPEIDTALIDGADYLVHAQADITEDNAGNGNPDSPDDPDDGGWNWILTAPQFTHSAAASSTNLYGATALGLYYAYLETSDASYKTALDDAAGHMITDSEIDSGSDLVFLMLYDDLPGVSGTTYQDSAKTKYDAKISTHSNATAWAEYIRDARAGQGYENGIIPWDIGIWVKAAAMLHERYSTDGYDSDADDMAEVIYQDSFMQNPGYFNLTTNKNNGWDPNYGNLDYYWYSLGITGLIDSFVTADVHTDKITSLLTTLLECQYPSGAFSYCYGANTYDEDWQSTAYAVNSLVLVDKSTYQTEINHACYWLAATQDPSSGGWVYSSGNHYPEVCGECTSALYFEEEILEVTQPIQVTANESYERGQSIVYDGSNYWMFFGRSEGCNDPYSSGNPDVNDYVLYYEKANSIAGFASGSKDNVELPVDDIYLGETGAAYLNGNVWVFVPIDVGTTCSLYGYYTDDGGTWYEVGPYVSDMSDGQAHHDEVAFNGEIWILEGSGNYHTVHSSTPTDDTSFSTPLQVGASESLTGGLGHFFVDGSNLYLALGSGGSYYIYWYNDTGTSWELIASKTITGYYDPFLFKVDDHYIFAAAPYTGGRQWIVGWASTTIDSGFFDGRELSIAEGRYGANEWVDMWPIGYTDDNGDTFLFFTSERNPDDTNAEIDGNIWYLKYGWDPFNDHYTYIQEAVDAASNTIIDVAAGTYYEEVTIDKSLTLTGDPGDSSVGPGVDAPILDGGGGLDINGITIDGGVSDVTIEGFEICNYNNSGGSGGVGSGILAWDSDPINNVIVRDNYIHDIGWDAVLVGNEGQALHDNWLIENNIAEDCGVYSLELTNAKNSEVLNNIVIGGEDILGAWDSEVGILLYTNIRSPSTTGQTNTNIKAENNTVSGPLMRGIWVVAGDSQNSYTAVLDGVTVRNNNVTGASSAGVYIYPYGANAEIKNVTIDGNDLDGNNKGIFLVEWNGGTLGSVDITGNQIMNSVEDGVYVYPGTSAANIIVNYNDITGNTLYGICNSGTGTLDAECNWYGDISGPGGYGPGTGDNVSTDVGFVPWLDDAYPVGDCVGDCTDTIYVDDDAASSWYNWSHVASIQTAVDRVCDGGTVHVAEGIYSGAIINKSVMILGSTTGDSIIGSGVPYKSGSGLQTAFRLDAGADGTEIRNLTINCNATTNFFFAVFSRSVDDVIIDSFEVNDAVQGISNYDGSNWEITNNVLTDTVASGGGGIGIMFGVRPPQDECSGNLVQNNIIHADGTEAGYTAPGVCLALDTRYGAYSDLTGSEEITNNEISNNTITGTGNVNEVGIEVGVIGVSGNSTKVAYTMGMIHDNLIQNNTVSGSDYGIYAYVVEDLVIEENEVKNCISHGISIWDDFTGNINNNNIFGNGNYGLWNNLTTNVDATCNWWGAITGPNHASNSGGTGDNVSDNVGFLPWLTDVYPDGECVGGECVDPVYVDDDAATGWYDWSHVATIATAIDRVCDGGTIYVAAGHYVETVDLKVKELTIDGSGLGNTIINASSFSGYAISNFADNTTIQNLTLIGTDHYGFKISHVSGITLENIRVQDSGRTGVDMHTVQGATLTNIEVVDTVSGFGIMILDSQDIDVTDITTSNNPWGGVSVHAVNVDAENITFSGSFDADEPAPLLLEQDPPYGAFINVGIPSKFDYVVYGFRAGTWNFKQWYYQENLTNAKSFANGLITSGFPYEDMLIFDVAKDNYYVIPGMLIQDAIDDATGTTIHIDAGTYNENITVNKHLTFIGAGSGTNGTIITQDSSGAGDSHVGVVQITASGISDTDPILFQDLRIEPVSLAGFSIGRFTAATGTDVSYIKLDNVHVIGTNTNPSTEQERGLYVDLTSSLSYLTIVDSAFNNLTYGWYTQKQVSADTSTVSHVSVTNTEFNHNNHKGVYAEKLSDTTFTGCTVNENGFDSSALPSYFAPWSAGIDVNLKAGTYEGFVFDNCVFIDNAIDEAKEGVALTVKERGTGNNPSGGYVAYPAHCDDVTVTQCTFTNNERGMRFGEPGKENLGPTNVTVEHCNIVGNVQHYSGSDGSAYGGLINQMQAGILAECNWWGDISGPSGDGPGTGDAVQEVVGSIDYIPWLDDIYPYGDCSGGGIVHNLNTDEWFSTIQSAIDDSGTDNGHSLEIIATTLTEGPQIIVSKNLTISGQGCTSTIIAPTGNTGGSGDSRGWWLVNSGIELHLSNMKLDGTGFDIYQGIRHKGSGTIDQVCFNEIKYPGYGGVAVAAFGGGPVNITNCQFTEIGRIGVLYWVTDSLFEGNSYVGKGDGDWLDYCLDIGGGGGVTVINNTVSGCSGVASSDGSESAGFLVTTYYGSGSYAIIEENDVSDCTMAIAVGYDAADTSSVIAHYNNFIDCEWGITSTAPIVNGTCNWWDHISGPYHEISNPLGLGCNVSDNVTFIPWLTDEYPYGDCNGYPDTDPPQILNVDAQPDPQIPGGNVNITCTVTDDTSVAQVRVHITDPNSGTTNLSMIQRGDYYYEDSYTIVGTYTYYIWAIDGNDYGATSPVHTFEITSSLTADFEYTPNNPLASETVYFTDLSSVTGATIVNWSWTFGDGGVSYDQNPSHQYTSNGKYSVILTVEDDTGNTDTISKLVPVGDIQNAVNPMNHWNLISLPFNQSIDKEDIMVKYNDCYYSWDQAVTQGIVSDVIFGWDGGSYVFASILEPGEGYWCYCYETCEFWVDVVTVPSDDYITELEQGWNIMSVPDDQPLNKVDIIVNYGGTDYSWADAVTNGYVNDVVFGWDRNTQSYNFANTFIPSDGYWMYAYQPCILKQ